MAIATVTEWTCDLCGVCTTAPSTRIPDGWVKYDIPDRMEDRKWHTKAVCNTCANVIAAAKARKAKE